MEEAVSLLLSLKEKKRGSKRHGSRRIYVTEERATRIVNILQDKASKASAIASKLFDERCTTNRPGSH